MFNKRGMSPIVATVLLIAFAVALGAMVMSLGDKITGDEVTCENVEITLDNLCNRNGILYPVAQGKDNKPVTCEEQKIDPGKIMRPCP